MSKGTLLLVDDSPMILTMLSTAFGDEGYTVRTARSGEEALASLEQAAPELVVTDIMMPGMDGYELCHRIRSRSATRTVPILAVTETTGLEAKLLGFQAGVDDFVTKDTPGRSYSLAYRRC